MALNLKVSLGSCLFNAVITSSHPWSWSFLFDWIFFFPLVAFVCFLYLDLATFLVKIINFGCICMFPLFRSCYISCKDYKFFLFIHIIIVFASIMIIWSLYLHIRLKYYIYIHFVPTHLLHSLICNQFSVDILGFSIIQWLHIKSHYLQITLLFLILLIFLIIILTKYFQLEKSLKYMNSEIIHASYI